MSTCATSSSWVDPRVFFTYHLCNNCRQHFLPKELESTTLCPDCRETSKQDCPCGGPAGHVPGGIHCRKP